MNDRPATAYVFTPTLQPALEARAQPVEVGSDGEKRVSTCSRKTRHENGGASAVSCRWCINTESRPIISPGASGLSPELASPPPGTFPPCGAAVLSGARPETEGVGDTEFSPFVLQRTGSGSPFWVLGSSTGSMSMGEHFTSQSSVYFGFQGFCTIFTVRRRHFLLILWRTEQTSSLAFSATRRPDEVGTNCKLSLTWVFFSFSPFVLFNPSARESASHREAPAP